MTADDSDLRSSLGDVDDSLVAEHDVESSSLPEVKIRWAAVLTRCSRGTAMVSPIATSAAGRTARRFPLPAYDAAELAR